MSFKQIWANLPVEDTRRTEKFYTALGFRRNKSETTDELTSFLFSEADFVIHFFRRDKLEFALNGKSTRPEDGNEVIFSISAATEAEVDDWAEKAVANGGKSITPAGRQSDGYYYCVFADPDGHKYNALFVEDGM